VPVLRHLRREPVSARPDTFAYRAVTFARRHPLGTTAAAAALVAAALFTAGIAWQAREARRQRDEARAQMARATASREFMGFLLSAAFPPGSTLTPDNLLEQGEAVVDKEYADNAPLHAEMLVAIGKQYVASERFEKAAPVLERAAAIAEKSGDRALQARALCPLALLRMAGGDQETGDALMARAFERIPDDPLYAMQRAECLIDRGTFNMYLDRPAPMKRDGAAALAILNGFEVPATAKRIEAMGLLAYAHYLDRETREADALYADIMAELERAGRDRTLLAADINNNWGLLHFSGNLARAEPLCRRAVELRRSIEGAEAIAPTVTFNHAAVLMHLARYDEALPLYEETIRTARARKEQRIETDAMLELSGLYVDAGDLDRADAQLKTLGPMLTGPRPDPFRQVQMAYYQGLLTLARGDAAGARDHFASAVGVFESRNSRIALFVFSLLGLSRAHLALGDPATAAAKAERAIEVAASFVGKDGPSYLIGLSEAAVADARLQAGDRDAARAAFTQAVEHLTTTLGASHPATAAARRGLATLGAQAAVR